MRSGVARGLRLGGRQLGRDQLQRRRLLRDDRLELARSRASRRRTRRPRNRASSFCGDVVGVREGELADAAQVDAIDDSGCRTRGAWLSAPLRPTMSILTVLPCGEQRAARPGAASLAMLELKPPARPRSPVMTISRCTWSRPVPTSSGDAPLVGDARAEAGHHLVHALGVGARGGRRLLRAAQLRRGDHLHRLGDLARRLDEVMRLRRSFKLGIRRLSCLPSWP